ncbi:MAG: hypothetical protein AAF512_12070, partial [Pseudomonadota bacterium]
SAANTLWPHIELLVMGYAVDEIRHCNDLDHKLDRLIDDPGRYTCPPSSAKKLSGNCYDRR